MISFAIPIYNAEDTIEKCVKNIIKQIREDDEIILIDDGSVDRSKEICIKLKEQYSRYINFIEQPNLGVSKTRNRAISEAKGEWIQFIDSDDFIDDKYYYEINKVIKSNKEIDLLLFGIKHIGKNNIVQYVKKPRCCETLDKTAFISKFYYYMDNHLINSPCNKLYKLDILRKRQIKFPEHICLGEDLIFNLNYIQEIKNVRFIDEALYIYIRQEKDSLSTRYYSNILEINEYLHKSLCEFIELNDKSKNIENINFLSKSFFDYLSSNYRNALNIEIISLNKNRKKEMQNVIENKYFSQLNMWKIKNKKSLLIYILTKLKNYYLIKVIYKLISKR